MSFQIFLCPSLLISWLFVLTGLTGLSGFFLSLSPFRRETATTLLSRLFSDSVLLTFGMLKGDIFPRRGIKVFAFFPERQKTLNIPGPELAYEAYPCKSCLRFSKKAPMRFGNLAPGQACKSCLTEGMCLHRITYVVMYILMVRRLLLSGEGPESG